MFNFKNLAFCSFIVLTIVSCNKKNNNERQQPNSKESNQNQSQEQTGSENSEGANFETTLNLPELAKPEKLMLASQSTASTVIPAQTQEALDTSLKLTSSCLTKRTLASGVTVENFSFNFLLLSSDITAEQPYGKILMKHELKITNECAVIKAQIAGLKQGVKYRLVLDVKWIDANTQENSLAYFGASNYFTIDGSQVAIDLHSANECESACIIEQIDPSQTPTQNPPTSTTDVVATLDITGGYKMDTAPLKTPFQIARDGKMWVRDFYKDQSMKEYSFGQIEVKYISKLLFAAGGFDESEMIVEVSDAPECADAPEMAAKVRNEKGSFVTVSLEKNCKRYFRKDGKEYKYRDLIFALQYFADTKLIEGTEPGWTGNDEQVVVYEMIAGYAPADYPRLQKSMVLENGTIRFSAQKLNAEAAITDIGKFDSILVKNMMRAGTSFTENEMVSTTPEKPICSDVPTVKRWIQNGEGKMVEVLRNAQCHTFIRKDGKNYQYDLAINGISHFSSLLD